MYVRLILMLSLLGLVVGILSVVGVVRDGGQSMALWTVLALYFGATLARRAPGKLFMHGFLTAFIAGVLGSLVLAVFSTQYLSHNPQTASGLKTMSASLSPAALLVVFTPVTAGVMGVTTGLFALAFARVAHARSPAA